MLNHPRPTLWTLTSAGIAAGMLALAPAAQAALTDGLEAYWNFDDADNLFHDATGNGNDATSVVGNPTQGVGKVGPGSLSLTGSAAGGDGAIINPTLGSSESFTLSAWIKIDPQDVGVNRPRTIMFKQNGTAQTGWNLYAYSANNRPVVSVMSPDDGNVFVGAAASNSLPDDVAAQWNHIAFVYDHDAQTGLFYINGELTASATDLITAPNDATPLAIGLRTGAEDRGWHGDLDELAIWSRSLTGGEVAQLADGAAIPEPVSLALFGSAGLMVLLRRPRASA